MESFAQEHVIGIPLASFAYAQEEAQGKPSCSALIHKKSKNLTSHDMVPQFSFCNNFTLYMPILI
jgi:hypothetical protein